MLSGACPLEPALVRAFAASPLAQRPLCVSLLPALAASPAEANATAAAAADDWFYSGYPDEGAEAVQEQWDAAIDPLTDEVAQAQPIDYAWTSTHTVPQPRSLPG